MLEIFRNRSKDTVKEDAPLDLPAPKKSKSVDLTSFVVSVSLANLAFVDAWSEVVAVEGYYYRQTYKIGAQALAILIDVGILAGFVLMFLVLLGSRRRITKCVGAIGLAGVSIASINAVRHQVSSVFPDGYAQLFMATALLVMLGLAVLCGTSPFRVFRRGLLVVAPMLLITSTQAAFLALKYSAGYFTSRNSHLADKLPLQSSPHVVLLVFDELDHEVAFISRPETLAMPTFDRLRTEAVWANEARSAGGSTMISMPRIITGARIDRVAVRAPDELSLMSDTSDQVLLWSSEPNLFSIGRTYGLNGAIVGWYHPYCRVFGRSLTVCNSQSGPGMPSRDTPIVEAMLHHAKTALLAFPSAHRIAAFHVRDEKRMMIAKVEDEMTRATVAITDASLNLVLVHLPVPHPPSIYARKAGHFSVDEKGSYLDNLALADSLLNNFWQALDRAGMWEKTTLIVTSDHGWRVANWKKEDSWTNEDQLTLNNRVLSADRVPFIVKLAGQHVGTDYVRPINNIVTADLILAIIRRQLATPKELTEWLDATGTSAAKAASRPPP